MNHQKEIWKDIKGYEGLYKVSNLGNIRSLIYKGRTNIRLRKQRKNNNGYMRIGLHKNKVAKIYTVSRLIAIAFILNPKNKPQVNHKNGIKTDNIVDNLEWVTQSENMLHAYKCLGIKGNRIGLFGAKHPTSKAISQFTLSGEHIQDFGSQLEASRFLNVRYPSWIGQCCLGKGETASGYKWKFKK